VQTPIVAYLKRSVPTVFVKSTPHFIILLRTRHPLHQQQEPEFGEGGREGGVLCGPLAPIFLARVVGAWVERTGFLIVSVQLAITTHLSHRPYLLAAAAAAAAAAQRSVDLEILLLLLLLLL
jgi:hypothetical protein